jgi:hypothetical protein
LPQTDEEKRKQAYLHSQLYAQPIHRPPSTSNLPLEEKNSYFHLPRIKEHLDNRRSEKQENKRVKELGNDLKKKDEEFRKSEIQRIKEEREAQAEIQRKLETRKISVKEYKDIQHKTLSRLPGMIGSGGALPSGFNNNVSEKDKKELEQVQKDIKHLRTRLEGVQDADKDEDNHVGLLDQQKKASGDADTKKLDKEILNVQSELQRLYTRESQLKGVTGFAGIGNQKGTRNHKGEVIPDRDRKKQENTFQKEHAEQFGDKESGVLFLGSDGKPHYMKKRKVSQLNEATGEYENKFASTLSETKRKQLQEITYGNKTLPEELEEDGKLPDPIRQREAPHQKNEVPNDVPHNPPTQTEIALILGGMGKR